MSSPEGRSHVVHWERTASGVRAWLRDTPEISAIAPTTQAAGDALYLQVLERFGDGEALLEFDPRPETSGSESLAARYVALAYNEAVEVKNERAALFQRGICECCERGVGGRSDEPLTLARKPRNDVFRASKRWPADIYPFRTCVSESFVELLSIDEREVLGLRPIVSPPRVSVRYFEISGNPVASAHGLRGGSYATSLDQSWRCAECGQSAFVMSGTEFPTGTVLLPATAMRRLGRDSFVFDEDGGCGPRAAFSPLRWREILAEGKALRGLSSSDVLVLDDARLEAQPTLPEHWKMRK